MSLPASFNTPAAIDHVVLSGNMLGMSTVSDKEFGQNLDKARKTANMSMRDLGAKIGTSASYVHRVISGSVCPSIERAEKLAEAVNSSLPELLRPNGKKSRERG